jgi:hypothetical protein
MPRPKSKRTSDDAASEEPALTDDEKLALELLIGSVAKDERGLPFRRYLVDEREARRAIVRLFESEAPLHPMLRGWLAILFEPDGRYSKNWSWGGERQLMFRFRKQGRHRDTIREAYIVLSVFVGTHQGLTVDKAIEATAEKYRLSQETIRRLWDKYPGFRSARRA